MLRLPSLWNARCLHSTARVNGLTRGKSASPSKKGKGEDGGLQAVINAHLQALVPAKARSVKVSPQEATRRALLAKEWSRASMLAHNTTMKRLCEVAKARNEAYAALALVSPRLHARALEIDPALWPIEHPQMAESAPVPGYRPAVLR